MIKNLEQSNDNKLSILIVAKNEENNLSKCLGAIKFGDETIVILDRTNDTSKQIAESYGAKVFCGSWPIEGDRRNFGIDNCSSKWILEVDADEILSVELKEEVIKEISLDRYDYFLIPFDNFIGKKLVRYGWGGSWGVSSAPRLFKNGYKSWGRQRIHPSLKLKGKEGRLKSRISHYVDKDISDMISRLDRYTYLKSLDLIESSNIGTLTNNIRRFFSRFIKCYFFRRGYREGVYGFLIALMAGLFPLLSYIRARLEKNK